MKWISTLMAVTAILASVQAGCSSQAVQPVTQELYLSGLSRRNVTEDFFVELPNQLRPLPEPLAEGQQPGFKIRGIKGWNWTPQQYLEEIPVLAKYKMNFLMNCYLSMLAGRENRWWEPLPESKKRAYEKVIRTCQQHGIQFCFSFHPQLFSSRPLDPTSDEDFEKFWQHFAWAQSLGVKWFSVPIDDVRDIRNDAAEHAAFLNKLFKRLRAKDPQAQFIFCPTWYWGCDGQGHIEYLETLGSELHKDVYLFWTGDNGRTPNITRQCAEVFKALVKHRIIIWDNYPVNANRSMLNLGPSTGRDPDICELVDGYMSNPMGRQNQINRIPLLTCADYAYNPKAYNPARSIGQAIVHLADTDEQRAVLKALVEAYPGFNIYKGRDLLRDLLRVNPVKEQFNRLASAPHSRYIAANYIRYMENLSARLARAFPHRFDPAKKTLNDNIAWMKQALSEKYKQ